MTRPVDIRVVEDDPVIAMLLSNFVLSDQKVEVILTDFEKLLDPKSWVGVDSTIIDYQLDKLNAAEIIRMLHKEWPEILIVLLTGSVDTDSIDKDILDMLGDNVLLKPEEAGNIRVALNLSREIQVIEDVV